MINSHKELVDEIRNFAEKFDLINSFTYMKDADRIAEEVLKSEPRTFVLGLANIEADDENYNFLCRYDFVMADQTIYDEESILQVEDEHMFCVSALSDYLNHLADSPIEMGSIAIINETDADSAYSSITGSFTFVIKRNGSYWKAMESYSV